jgi:type II secretory pathway pseudopilin PulG
VVVGIISVLIGILLPSLAKARQAGQRAVCSSNLRQLGSAVQLYLYDSKGIYPIADDPRSTSPLVWTWMGRGFRPLMEPYAKRSGSNPGVFWCPADDTATDKYDNTSYAYSMAFYHSVDQINAMSTVASQYSGPVASVPQKAGKVKYSSQKIMMGEFYSVHRPFKNDSGWWSKAGQRVFLFADSHVEYLPWASIIPANDTNPNPNVTVDGISGRDVR